MVENQPPTGYVLTLRTHLLNMFSCSYTTQNNFPTEKICKHQGLLSYLLYFHDSEHSLSSFLPEFPPPPATKVGMQGMFRTANSGCQSEVVQHLQSMYFIWQNILDILH